MRYVFDWDFGNSEKCRKHGVNLEEIEQALAADPIVIGDPRHSLVEERFHAVGRAASGRSIFVVFTIRTRGPDEIIRPISARYMHSKEVALYEKAEAISRSKE